MSLKLIRTVEYTKMAKNQTSEMKTVTSKTIRLNSRLNIAKKKKKNKIREDKVKDSCFQKETPQNRMFLMKTVSLNGRATLKEMIHRLLMFLKIPRDKK